jgi:predicted transcriptional regulator
LEYSGNTVVCDAMMRIIDRERAAEATLKTEAAVLLTVGFTKREVVEWAMKKGFVGSQLSDAVGISLKGSSSREVLD